MACQLLPLFGLFPLSSSMKQCLICFILFALFGVNGVLDKELTYIPIANNTRMSECQWPIQSTNAAKLPAGCWTGQEQLI